MRETLARQSAIWVLILIGLFVASTLLLGAVRFWSKATGGQPLPANVADVLSLHGRLVDAAGAPAAGATFVGTYEARMFLPLLGSAIATDAQGVFQGDFWLPPALNRFPAVLTHASSHPICRQRPGDSASRPGGWELEIDGAAHLAGLERHGLARALRRLARIEPERADLDVLLHRPDKP